MTDRTTTRKYFGATRLDQQVPGLLKSSYERFGFAYGQILTQWPSIVGEALAQYTQPERVRWPRRTAQKAFANDRRAGGTLVVRVEGPVAIEVQHATPQIVEAVNLYYGYDAITALKIVQGRIVHKPRRRQKTPPPLDQAREKVLNEQVATIEDTRLRDTLSRLGRNVLISKK